MVDGNAVKRVKAKVLRKAGAGEKAVRRSNGGVVGEAVAAGKAARSSGSVLSKSVAGGKAARRSIPFTDQDFGGFRRYGPRMDRSDPVRPPQSCVAALSVQDPAAESQRPFPPARRRIATPLFRRPLLCSRPCRRNALQPSPGHRFALDTAARTPRSLLPGHRFVQSGGKVLNGMDGGGKISPKPMPGVQGSIGVKPQSWMR